MGVMFNTLNPAFKTFLTQVISHHITLDPSDPYKSAVPVSFDAPEDLHYEYHANIKSGKLYIPTSSLHKKDDLIRIQMKIMPNLDIIRVKAKVLIQGENIYGADTPYWILVKLLGFAKGDKKRLFDYIKTLNKRIGKNAVDDERMTEVQARQKMVETEVRTQAGAAEGLTRFILSESQIVAKKGLPIADPNGNIIAYADLPYYAKSGKLVFYDSEKKARVLFYTDRKNIGDSDKAIHVLYQAKNVPSAFLEFTNAPDPTLQKVRINLKQGQELCTLMDRSIALGKPPTTGQSMFMFKAPEEVLGILYKTGKDHFCLDLGDYEQHDLDKKVAMAAAVILKAQLV
jgi:hypothetical protein